MRDAEISLCTCLQCVHRLQKANKRLQNNTSLHLPSVQGNVDSEKFNHCLEIKKYRRAVTMYHSKKQRWL